MLELIRKIRIKKYSQGALKYFVLNYRPPQYYGMHFNAADDVKDADPQQAENSPNTEKTEKQPQYSIALPIDALALDEEWEDFAQQKLQERENTEDKYNASAVSQLLRGCSSNDDFGMTRQSLGQRVNQGFVDRMLFYISKKGMRDSEVYKAAQVDKRLFSKMVSNRDYRPSKDTAIALSFALRLSLSEANDMLSRAGYTLSHSNKRDVIIEYFFREQVFNLMDINHVLYGFGEKIIGREEKAG